MKQMFCGLVLCGCAVGPVNGMFLIPQNFSDDSHKVTLRHVTDDEEEECLMSYEKGMAIDNDTVNLKHAIIGRDSEYGSLVERGIAQAISSDNIDYKMIYNGAVVQDIFATLGYRFEALGKYSEAFFWLKVAAVGNPNYLQDAQRVKNEYSKKEQ